MVGDCILSEKKENAFQYTIKYIFFAAVLLVVAALLYYAYDRFVPHERALSPVSSEPFGTVIIDVTEEWTEAQFQKEELLKKT